MTISPAVVMALFAALTLLLSAATFFAGWVLRVGKGEGAAEAVKRQQDHIDRLERDFANFKEHVASNYASNSTVAEVEKRIVDAINRLGDRLDRLFHPTPPA